MTKQECQQLIDAYVAWLRDGLSAINVQDACELTTPFLDRHNDHLQIYAVKRDGNIVLSDDGYILSDLRTSGFELRGERRKASLRTLLDGFGVRVEEGKITTEASARNLGQRIHSLIQAMLAVNDLYLLAQPRVTSFFWEDVREFLDRHKVRYSPRVKIAGRSGFDHAIDFLIPKSPRRPERFIQVINSPRKNTIGTYLFALVDTLEARAEGSQAYAFINDRDRQVGGDVIEALRSYDVGPILWSQRQQFVQVLAE